MEEERSPVLDVVGSGDDVPLDNDTRTDMELLMARQPATRYG